MGFSNRGGAREKGGRPSNWKNEPTKAIRVPEVLTETLLEIAHQLDEGTSETIIINPKSLETYKQTKQQHLSMPRVYKQSGHKTIRVEELLNALQRLVAD